MGIVVKDLSFSYKKLSIIENFSFVANEKEIVLIRGDSGQGKSSLLNVISGLKKPDSGTITCNNVIFNNENIFLEPEKRNLGYVFQDFALFPHINAESNIKYAMSANDINLFDEAINALNLKDHLQKMPHELSGGQQQRVAAARAMATKPEVIFADEPSGNLDSKSSKELLVFMKSVVEELNQTIIMVTHDPYAASFANRVVMLKDGKVASDLEEPTQEEIISEVTALSDI